MSNEKNEKAVGAKTVTAEEFAEMQKAKLQLAKQRMYSERARVRQLLLAKKATEKGIEVSDAEVDAYIAKKA